MLVRAGICRILGLNNGRKERVVESLYNVGVTVNYENGYERDVDFTQVKWEEITEKLSLWVAQNIHPASITSYQIVIIPLVVATGPV